MRSNPALSLSLLLPKAGRQADLVRQRHTLACSRLPSLCMLARLFTSVGRDCRSRRGHSSERERETNIPVGLVATERYQIGLFSTKLIYFLFHWTDKSVLIGLCDFLYHSDGISRAKLRDTVQSALFVFSPLSFLFRYYDFILTEHSTLTDDYQIQLSFPSILISYKAIAQ